MFLLCRIYMFAKYTPAVYKSNTFTYTNSDSYVYSCVQLYTIICKIYTDYIIYGYVYGYIEKLVYNYTFNLYNVAHTFFYTVNMSDKFSEFPQVSE